MNVSSTLTPVACSTCGQAGAVPCTYGAWRGNRTSGSVPHQHGPDIKTQGSSSEHQARNGSGASHAATEHKGSHKPWLWQGPPRRPWHHGGATGPDDPLVMLAALPVPGVLPQQHAPGFRFWIDEVLWSKGRVAVELAEEVFVSAGGTRSGGPGRGQQPMHNITSGSSSHGHSSIDEGSLGLSHMQQWELLWTKSTYALKAARGLRLGQLVSAIAGLNSLTMKKRMLQTLKASLGDGAAFQITPVSFALPEELPQWRAWLASNRSADPGLWMLKTGQDAGKGLKLLPTKQALEEAARPPRSSKHKRQLKVAQLYITRPLLLEGRKWHLRLWVVVTGHAPLVAYLHRRGLVLFSSEVYTGKLQPTDAGQGPVPAGHITNYARNSNSMVWSLEQLEQVLGHSTYERLWTSLLASTSDALRAAGPSLHEANAWLRPSIPDYGFQMIGVDYLVDDQLHPWLLEFNSSPSIMVQHDSPDVRELIYQQKRGMMQDMIALVRHRLRPSGGSCTRGGPGSSRGGAPSSKRRGTDGASEDDGHSCATEFVRLHT